MTVNIMIGIDTLKKKARDWALKVKKVNAISEPLPPALEKERSGLLSFAKKIKENLEAIFGTIDELNGVGLGAVPVIVPIAVIAAAAAAITKWTYDYNAFNKKYEEYRRLQASGISPAQAGQIVQRTFAGSGILANLGQIAPVLLVGAGIYALSRFSKGE